RKCLAAQDSILLAQAENSGGIESASEDLGAASNSVLGFDRADSQDRIVELETRFLADIKSGMGVENLQPGKQQEEQTDRPSPMGEARPDGLTVEKHGSTG